MTDRRVAITGAGGQLGRPLVAVFRRHGWDVLGADHAALEITDPTALRRISDWSPDVVVNAAAWTDVDGCARDPQRAAKINGEAAGLVAAAAERAGALAVQISTNEVFDGSAALPYREEDPPRPINPYGASKLVGERAVAATARRHLVVRTAWIFGPQGRNFPSKIVALARRSREGATPLRVVDDEIGNPTWAPDLAEGIRLAVELALGGEDLRLLHVAGDPPASRYAWACLALATLDGVTVAPIGSAEFPRPAPVPPRAVLDLSRATGLGIGPFDWRAATTAYVATL